MLQNFICADLLSQQLAVGMHRGGPPQCTETPSIIIYGVRQLSGPSRTRCVWLSPVRDRVGAPVCAQGQGVPLGPIRSSLLQTRKWWHRTLPPAPDRPWPEPPGALGIPQPACHVSDTLHRCLGRRSEVALGLGLSGDVSQSPRTSRTRDRGWGEDSPAPAQGSRRLPA